MDATAIHILLVEDNPGDARLLRELLAEGSTLPVTLEHVDRLDRALPALARGDIDAVLLDLTLPDGNGIETLDRVLAAAPAIPVIVLTGVTDEDTALSAVERGAQDYLIKGQVDGRLLARSIRYAIQRTRADETTRKLEREQLQRARADAERVRLFSLFMQAPVAICVLSGPAHTFELANPLFCRLVGEDRLVGRSLLEALPELMDQGIVEMIDGVVGSSSSSIGSEVIWRLDRRGTGLLEELHVDSVCEPVQGGDGLVEGVMMVVADVTERVLARRAADEARLRAEASEERFRQVAEIIPQIVWTTGGDGVTTYLSQRWADYTGQPLPLSSPDMWRQVIHDDDWEKTLVLWAAAIAKRATWECEYRIRRSDGVYRWHLGRAVPHCDADGNIISWYGTATEIDEQRKAIRTRDDLLATVSHDLRNPLSSVRMAATLLAKSAESPLLAKTVVKMSGVLERAVNSMEVLIRDLLDMASIESGHLAVHPMTVPVAALVDEALELIGPLAVEKALHLDHGRLPPGAMLHCDRDRILQVLSNILGNAVKFTPAGGRITIDAHVQDRFVVFAIADSGPGIAPDQLPLVFDRFWQAKETAKAGTGLGLAICKGIVVTHGGEIWVESQLGRGTTFFFTLPVTG